MRRALVLVLISIVACSGTARPTLDELAEQDAQDIDTVIASWDCGVDSFQVMHIGRGALTEAAAIEAATDGLKGGGYGGSVAEATRVGSVWWLADDEGVVFAALSVEGGLTVCFAE